MHLRKGQYIGSAIEPEQPQFGKCADDGGRNGLRVTVHGAEHLAGFLIMVGASGELHTWLRRAVGLPRAQRRCDIRLSS